MDLAQIETDILSFEDPSTTDIRIKPQFYIHTALLMAQRALMFSVVKGGIGDGIVTYSVFIEHIEVLCKAANFITDAYNETINEFKQTDEYKNIKREDVRLARLSNKKLEELMREVFNTQPINRALFDSPIKK